MAQRMTRREVMRRLGLAGAAALSLRGPRADAAAAPAEPARGGRPNIVIILADDLGWADVGYHGSEIKTPNIDRIAGEGLRLERFYACPICSPTRAGLMTGRWPLRVGIMRAVIPPWRKYGLPPEEELLPEMLAKAGYERRGCFGKWHLGHCHRRFHPVEQGFTHFYGCYNGAIDYFTHEREGELDWHRGHEPARESGYTTTLLAGAAARFIAECPADKPFFVYLPFNAPHTPLQAPKKYLDRYPRLQGRRKTFAAMVDCMDEGIGRVLAALDEKGVADNTLVWFFSDNGGGIGASNKPLRGGKQTLFEGGIRVPAAVRWPAGGLTGGRKVSAVMGYIDVLPTLRRIVGAARHAGKPLDGVDVHDALAGRADPPERKWYSYWAQAGENNERLAVIAGAWKLVREGPPILAPRRPAGKAKGAKLFLFRINEDPNERTNLAEKHPDVVNALLKDLRTFRALRKKDGLPPYGQGREGFEAPTDWTMPAGRSGA